MGGPAEVNLFETTIRILGGLLSAQALAAGSHPRLAAALGEKATELGARLMPAFDSPSGGCTGCGCAAVEDVLLWGARGLGCTVAACVASSLPPSPLLAFFLHCRPQSFPPPAPGVPYSDVNLRTGKGSMPAWGQISSLSEISSVSLEFTYLAR